MTTLYRAAPAGRPYFGQGSYWSASPDFARRFGGWAHGRPELADRGEYVTYQAEVDLGRLLDIPFPLMLPSEAVSARVREFAARGYRWVAFHEGVFEGTIIRQYVYLGDGAIPAELREQS